MLYSSLRIQKFLFIVSLCVFFRSNLASAEFSSTSRPSHFLNSQTIGDGMEVSYLGNLVVALDSNTDIGTQGLFLLSGLPNLYLKHRMFDFENGSTTFNTYLVPYRKGNTWGGGLGFYYSVTTGLEINPSSTINIGVGSAGYLDKSLVLSGEGTALNLYHIDFSYDLMISNTLSFNFGTLIFPYIDVNLESDLIDAKISGFNPALSEIIPFFATLTFSPTDSSFHLEGGVWGISPGKQSGLSPYLSLYWRLK
ncbi:MAG: hypothetical protein WCI18_13840 [Pseudomonadota bacterium]